MTGPKGSLTDPSQDHLQGIIPRALTLLFQTIEDQKSNGMFKLSRLPFKRVYGDFNLLFWDSNWGVLLICFNWQLRIRSLLLLVFVIRMSTATYFINSSSTFYHTLHECLHSFPITTQLTRRFIQSVLFVFRIVQGFTP